MLFFLRDLKRNSLYNNHTLEMVDFHWFQTDFITSYQTL